MTPKSVRPLAAARAGWPIACLLGQLGLPLYRFTDVDNPRARTLRPTRRYRWDASAFPDNSSKNKEDT